jgi:hypothetical protein
VNDLLIGMPNDIVHANTASQRMSQNGEITSEDWSVMGRLGVRTAAIVGTAGLISAYGPASSTVTAGAKGAAGYLGGTVGAAGAAVATSAATREINSLIHGNQNQESGPVVQATSSSGSFLPLVLVVGLGSLALIFIKKRK